MNEAEFRAFYERDDVAEEIVRFCKGREAVGRDLRGGYMHRPSTINYAGDIRALISQQRPVRSFHASVEHWSNPLNISTEMKPEELRELRTGWDFLIDLDSQELEFSKIAGHTLCQALEAHGLKNIPVKYSGRAGFHLLLSFDIFPSTWQGKPMKDCFPELPKALSLYLADFIKEIFAKRLSEHLGKPVEDPFKYVKIDSMLVSSRHLVRCPYSYHEKTWLVSIPVAPKNLLTFDKETARPDQIGKVVKYGLCEGDSMGLVDGASIFWEKFQDMEREKNKNFSMSVGGGNSGALKTKLGKPIKVLPEAYPPCIWNILNQKDIEEGRKRRLFVLQNFLLKIGKTPQEMADFCIAWNASLKNPLQSQYVTAQIKSFAVKKEFFVPNCENEAYMKDTKICTKDNFCNEIKNPISYVFKKGKFIWLRMNDGKKRKGKKTNEK